MNAYTKSCKKSYKVFACLSWLLCFGVAAFLIIKALNSSKLAPSTEQIKETTEKLTMKEKYGSMLCSLLVTIIIVSILSIIVKDKVEPTVWMVNVILAGYCFSMTAVYIVFGLWFVDNYVLKALKRHYKTKYQINKEIDSRDER